MPHRFRPRLSPRPLSSPDAVRYLAQEKMQPVFAVAREHFGDDPHLPVFRIKLRQWAKRVA